MKRKVSICIGLFQKQYGDKRALEIAKEIGADAVDFDLIDQSKANSESVYSLGADKVREYYSSIKEYAKEIGIEIAQTHGRIKGFKNIKAEDDLLIEDGELDCIATASLGAPHCVMHTVTTIHMGPNASDELMHFLNYDMYARILPFAKRENVKIATETFGNAENYGCIDYFGDATQFIKGYEKVKNESGYGDWFCVCMDTGHTNKAMPFNNNPPAHEFIKMLGSSIQVLHLNDNDTKTDQHKTPLTGSIDWKAVMGALEEIGYNGYYNLELNLRHFGVDFAIEEARFAIKVMRQMFKLYYNE